MQRTCALVLTALIAVAVLVGIPQGTAPEIVRGAAAHSPRTPESRAADSGIQIIWTQSPCGWTAAEAGGCFDIRTPNQIQIVPSADFIAWQNYTILHELGHYRQYRLGLPYSECDADRQAIVWGALFSGYECPGLPGYSTWAAAQQG